MGQSRLPCIPLLPCQWYRVRVSCLLPANHLGTIICVSSSRSLLTRIGAVRFGFNCPLDQAAPGLTYYTLELNTIGRPDLPVLITETGWATHRDGLPTCSEQDKADWTVGAYNGLSLLLAPTYSVCPWENRQDHCYAVVLLALFFLQVRGLQTRGSLV